MGFKRAAFAAGLVIGFIAGARAGRERYDQIVKYSQKAYNSPPVQKALKTASAKGQELSKLAAERATAASKTAAERAPKAAGSVARKAREQASKVSVPTPKRWRTMRPAHPAGPDSAATTNASVNGNGRGARTTYE